MGKPSDLIPLLYANQSLAELATVVRSDPRAGNGGALAALLRAQALFESGDTQAAQSVLGAIVDDSTSPTRATLWAAEALRSRGLWPSGNRATAAQGIVVDVPARGARDVLAVYRDCSARFASGNSTAVY